MLQLYLNCHNFAYHLAYNYLLQIATRNHMILHQSTAASTWWCGPRRHLGWVEMAVGLPEGPSYPRHSPSFYRYAAP